MELISLQKTTGQFAWGPPLERALAMTLEQAEKSSPAPAPGCPLGAWISVLAVAYLEGKMGPRKVLWELVAEKALRFVRGCCPQEAVERMTEEATKIVERIA